jgi:hypothetical protein
LPSSESGKPGKNAGSSKEGGENQIDPKSGENFGGGKGFGEGKAQGQGGGQASPGTSTPSASTAGTRAGGAGGFEPALTGQSAIPSLSYDSPADPTKRFDASQREGQSVQTYWSNSQLAASEDGHATVRFKLPDSPGVYRVFVEGRSGERLGLYKGKIIAREAPAAAAKPEPQP